MKFSSIIDAKKYNGKSLKKNLLYWLENLEKKFVYNHCYDQYGMAAVEVDEAILWFGYENVKIEDGD